jgi:diguanylate cyclase (GGDEF)-like protein
MPQESPAAEIGSSEDLLELRRRNAELQVLYETIRDLTSTLSVREVLDRLVGRALVHLEAEIGSILLRGPDERSRIVVARGLPPEVVDNTALEPNEGITGFVLATGEPLLVQDIERDARFRRRNHERYYTSSFISAPLVHMGTPRGVINVNNKRSRVPFCQADLDLLTALAGQAASSLANAQRYEAVLERANRDSLTGLANHGHFWSTLGLEFERADRHGRSISVALLDIDNFKRFNDTHGHLAGDGAICTVAKVLEGNSRAHDIVARYGGEEFAVILPETDADGASQFAEKMRMAVESASVEPEGEGGLTVSIGVASSDGQSRTAQELVALADDRLYCAKAAGRNRVFGSILDESRFRG